MNEKVLMRFLKESIVGLCLMSGGKEFPSLQASTENAQKPKM